MAKAKIVHSGDACTMIFKGSKKSPEPTTGVIKFPGGMVEVSRTSSGTYWAHVQVDKASIIANSRIDYDFEGWVKSKGEMPHVPNEKNIKHMAIEVDGPYQSTETL